MKLTLKTILSMVFAISLVTIHGCKKAKDGTPGKDGSANVTSRTFSASSWSWSSPNYYVDLNMPELTSSNINTAAVMVYFNTGGNYWYAVPYTQYTSASDYFMGFSTGAGLVEVTWFYDSSLSSGSSPNTYYGSTVQLKVVVIPPSVRKANPDLDLTNYVAVKKRFKLKD